MKKLILVVITIMAFLFSAFKVYALDISIDDVKIFDISSGVSVSNITSNKLTISPKIAFNNINDYVIYKISFKGSNLKKYTVKTITDNNKSEYIKTSYKYGDSLLEPVYLTLLYSNPSSENTTFNNIKINISLVSDGNEGAITSVDRETQQESKDTISNPQTGLFSHIIVPVILTIVMIFLIRHYTKVDGNSLMILILFVIFLPLTIYAKTLETLTISFDASNIIIKASTKSETSTPVTPTPTTPTKYYVYLYPNGGTGITDGYKFEYTGTTTFSNFPKVTKTNCTLDGWNVGSPTGKEYYQNVDASDNGQKLYARWSCGGSGAGDCKGSYTGPKYSLSTAEKQKLAGMVISEYGGDIIGMKAVASQMANLYEKRKYQGNVGGKSLYEYITTCGWYASADNPPSTNATALQAVEDVLVNGNRTLPLYIDEFDMYPGDIVGAHSMSDSNSYQVGVTKIANIYGSSGTYYCITKSGYDANIFFFTDGAEQYRIAKGYAKGY